MFRILSASGLFVLGFALGANSLYHGQPIVALALFLAGVYAALGVTLGIVDSFGNPIFKLAAGALGALGLIGVVAYNRAFDLDLQRAHVEAFSQMGAMEFHCKPVSAELRKVQQFGIAACATQGNSDQLGALVELSKGVHFGPTLTMVDNAIANTTDATPNFCAQAFKEVVRLCPSTASFVSASTRRALLEPQ